VKDMKKNLFKNKIRKIPKLCADSCLYFTLLISSFKVLFFRKQSWIELKVGNKLYYEGFCQE